MELKVSRANQSLFAFLILGAIAVTSMFSASAQASTTVGFPLTASPDSWQPTEIIAQRKNADPSGTGYNGFAVGGVLTSVTIKTRGAAANMSVFVLRKTADPLPGTASFLGVGAVSIPVATDATSAGHLTTVPTRMPVTAGDRFGATTPLTGTWYLYWYSASLTDYCFNGPSAHAPGASFDYVSATCNNYFPLVQGTVEPDADADGYGDESQDLCPTDATVQVACPVTAKADLAISLKRIGRPRHGRVTLVVATVTNGGPSAADNVVIRFDRTRKLRSLRMLGGTCKVSADRRSCTLASLAPRGKVSIRSRALGTVSGKTSLVVRVSSSTSDDVAGNNFKRATLRFRD